MSEITLWQGDCLEKMKGIPDGSVDMVLCDLPYGTTKCDWDKVIPFEPLWEQYKRICKTNAAIVLFSQQPFATDLINSNRKMFRYEWIWEKDLASGFMNAKKNADEMPRKYPCFLPKTTCLQSANGERHLLGAKPQTLKRQCHLSKKA